MTRSKTAAAPAGTVFQDLSLDQLEPHPHNVRHDLGDLTDMAKSIAEQGVLEPLLVLPEDLMGKHLVVAGHRRLAAALRAKPRPASVPCVIRPLTEAQVVEQMLVENMQRAAITPVEEAKAYGRLIDLESTVAKIAKRVGRSQAHVKGRLALLALPDPVLEHVATGTLTLEVAGEVVAHADDDDAMGWLVKELTSGRRHRPAELDRYVADRDARAALDEAKAKVTDAGKRLFTPKSGYFFLGSNQIGRSADRGVVAVQALHLPDGGARRHASEPCHAVYIEQESWGDRKLTSTTVCTDSIRHTTHAPAGKRSDLQSPPDMYGHLDQANGSPVPAGPDPYTVRRRATADQEAHAATVLGEVTDLDVHDHAVIAAGVVASFEDSLDDICRLLGLTLHDDHWREHFLAYAARWPARTLVAIGLVLCNPWNQGAPWSGPDQQARIGWFLAHGWQAGDPEVRQELDQAQEAWAAAPTFTVDDDLRLYRDGELVLTGEEAEEAAAALDAGVDEGSEGSEGSDE